MIKGVMFAPLLHERYAKITVFETVFCNRLFEKNGLNVLKTQPGVPTTRKSSMLADNLGAFLIPSKLYAKKEEQLVFVFDLPKKIYNHYIVL